MINIKNAFLLVVGTFLIVGISLTCSAFQQAEEDARQGTTQKAIQPPPESSGNQAVRSYYNTREAADGINDMEAQGFYVTSMAADGSEWLVVYRKN